MEEGRLMWSSTVAHGYDVFIVDIYSYDRPWLVE